MLFKLRDVSSSLALSCRAGVYHMFHRVRRYRNMLMWLSKDMSTYRYTSVVIATMARAMRRTKGTPTECSACDCKTIAPSLTRGS